MLPSLPYAALSSTRLYSTPVSKPSIKLLAELRKLTEVSISKAREALSATNNDLDAALEWLQKDLIATGAKKAAKIHDRVAGQGVICTSILSNGVGSTTGSVRAAMIELNCETDFVARNEHFECLAADIAHTAAYISEKGAPGTTLNACPLDSLNNAPLISQNKIPTETVEDSIRQLIAKIGEKICLRRAITVVENAPRPPSEIGLRVAAYVHGSVNNPSQGRIGSLALLGLKSPNVSALIKSDPFRDNLGRLERSLARQIVGFDTKLITASTGDETALYNQPFAMLAGDLNGQPVQAVLRAWSEQNGLVEAGNEDGGIAVLDFAKWTVGEAIEDRQSI
ncbi:Elongation factor TS domain containing protein [Amanita muscaria]